MDSNFWVHLGDNYIVSRRWLEKYRPEFLAELDRAADDVVD